MNQRNVVEVPLTHGKMAIIDAADAFEILKFKWYAIKRGRTFYAIRNVTLPSGKRTGLLMHRFLLGLTETNTQVDHRDCDGLNNRRSNLRSCTRSQNQRNRGPRKDSKTGLKGVTYHKKHRRFYARIFMHGTFKYLGNFETAAEAHEEYCKAADNNYGEFARFK